MRTAVGLFALALAYVISTATIGVVAMKAAMQRAEQQTQETSVPMINRSAENVDL
jgi:hypothetical protein